MSVARRLRDVRQRLPIGRRVAARDGNVVLAPQSSLTGPLPATVGARPLLGVVGPVGFAGLAVGLVARNPALVALGAPSAAVVVAGLLGRLPRTPNETGDELGVTVVLRTSTSRAVVDDDVEISVELTADRPIHDLEIAVRVPPGLTLVSGRHMAVLDVAPGEVRTHTFVVRGATPGARSVGPVVLRAGDALGLVEVERVATAPCTLLVLPRGEFLRTLLRAMHTGGHVGEQMSRRRGEGFEFADLRPWVPGDAARRIHWRASARREDPLVIERRPDRNQDVVLVVDAHAATRSPGGSSTLERSIELAAGIASAHLRARDRVGFVGFGSYVSWLAPGTGQLHRHRLLDALVSVNTDSRGLGRVVSSLASSVRPARAVVVVITPLLDSRSQGVLNDLRVHRYDVIVVIVPPVDDAAALVRGEANGDVAARLWQLGREEVVSAIAATGCAVCVAAAGTPLEQTVREVMTWRRQMPAQRRVAG